MRVPKSITVRLTVGLGVIALAVFATAGVILQRALEQALIEADRQELRGKLAGVMHFAEESARMGTPQSLRHHLDDLRIGHSRLAIGGLASEDGAGGAVLPFAAAVDGAGFGRVRRPDGVPFDTLQAELGHESAWPGGRIILGLDTRPRDRMLAQHQQTLIVVCALGVLATIVLGALATWRGLAQVSRLSRQAARITAHSPGARLGGDHGASELDGLVTAFNAVLDRLEFAYRQMESFSANVAHELRTPLATLVTSSQLMLSGSRSAGELQEMIASNLEELQQLSRLINDMLFLASADQGERARGLIRANLACEADRTLEYCQPLLDEGRVTGIRAGDASIECDPALVRRALVNLIVNAIRHTEPGQRIVVSVNRLATEVRLAVENPGPDIPAHVKAHMFDRFFRGDGARTRAGESHGLGLTIVAAIARMHGGAVFAEYTGSANRIGLSIPVPHRDATGAQPAGRPAG